MKKSITPKFIALFAVTTVLLTSTTGCSLADIITEYLIGDVEEIEEVAEAEAEDEEEEIRREARILIPYSHGQYHPSGENAAKPEDANSYGELSEEETAAEKYADLKVGDEIVFGEYGAGPIEWMVLDKDNDGNYLLFSKYAVEVMPYDYEDSENDQWEFSYLREWMNNDFYNQAFTEEERSYIDTSHLTNNDNFFENGDKPKSTPGADTYDKIFAFSYTELMTYFSYSRYYTMEESVSQIGDIVYTVIDHGYSRDALCPATEYVCEKDAYYWWNSENTNLEKFGMTEETYYKPFVEYWLRTGGCKGQVMIVMSKGEIGPTGYSVDSEGECVRPAMWVNFSGGRDIEPQFVGNDHTISFQVDEKPFDIPEKE